ncbi:MAG TPA: tyrosinase family protein [Solirubrobacteraceae bacterium]|nr:tyrosinase family protein [Solirubrobacteraceae bacterium]
MAADAHLIRYDVWDLNQGEVAAFPVKDPPGWDAVSLYYALALKAMGWQKSPDGDTNVESMWPYSDAPNSGFFQGAMHWWPKYRSLPPAPFNERWSHCTHGPAKSEQYFLAWHRAFIYFFEVIVRAWVAQLGGPDTWALPYWNYSYYAQAGPGAPWPRSNLPWVFAQAELPDGTDNPLYIADTAKRGLQPLWPGKQQAMHLETLTPYYDEAYAHTDFLGFNTTLDRQPHGAVHDDVGSGDGVLSRTGWMQNPVTAGFDPVFWLHHSEIDRFWVGWNAAGNANPSAPTWLNAEDDPLRDTRWNFWGDGDLANKVVVYPGQMLDPAKLADPFPYCYSYANLPTFPAPVPPGKTQVAATLPKLAAGPVATLRPQPVSGARSGPLELTKEPVSTPVPVPEQARAAVARLAEPAAEAGQPRVLLRLQGIVADGPPGNYEIYLNYPDADRATAGSVPHYVGLLAGFGADHHHAHGDDGEGAGAHEGHEGLDASYDITSTVAYLRAHGGWNESEATVTFVPASRPREGFELQTAGLRVGHVSIETT